VVFAVAQARCESYFSVPETMTLWSLPAALEDRFQDHWQRWLADREGWEPFFEALEEMPADDLVARLREFDLISDDIATEAQALRRSGEGRAVPLKGTLEPTDEALALLAAGFGRGEPGKPAVPYARLST
jgi:hypothetical protein